MLDSPVVKTYCDFFFQLGANEAELNGAYNIFPSRLPALAMLLNDENISQAENQWFEES